MRKQIWTRLSAAVMASLLTATPPSGAIALEYVTSLPFVESAATQPLVQTLMATGVPYLDETGTPQTAANATEIQSNTITWSNGWYVVHGDVTINGQVTVSGDVHLILADYANLTVNGGIFVKKGNHLHLYAQSTGADMGTLTAESQKEGNAGIGGGQSQGASGIAVHGDDITAIDGNDAADMEDAAKASTGKTVIELGTSKIGQSQGASGIAVHGDDITAIDGNDAADMEDAAKASTGKTVIELGTSKIKNPIPPENSSANWKGNYVYFGTFQNTPVKYRVLDNESNLFGGTTMLLDCDSVLEVRIFDPVDTTWSNSALKTYLNGDFFNNNFTQQERDAIASSTKPQKGPDEPERPVMPNLPQVEYIQLTGENIFCLAPTELWNKTYGYILPDFAPIPSRKKSLLSTGDEMYYWTRGRYKKEDADSYDVMSVHTTGIDAGVGPTRAGVGVSPAFNVNLSSVLFASQLPNTNADTDTEMSIR